MSFHDHTPQDWASREARRKRMKRDARHLQHPPVKPANPPKDTEEDPIELGYEVEHDFKSADEDRL